MKIYHGTSSRFLDTILKKGILPRGRKKGQWTTYPSRPDMVYLSVAYPFYFAACTKNKEERCLVFEVDTDLLDEDGFHPDEDFVAQAIVGPSGDVSSVHESIRDRLENFRQHWKLSLDRIGNCCFKGKILPRCITRYCLFDGRLRPALAMAFLDPTISILNYTFVGSKYRGMIAWMFGDAPLLPMATVDGFFGLPQDFPIKMDITESMKKQLEYWEEESKNKEGVEVCNLQPKKI